MSIAMIPPLLIAFALGYVLGSIPFGLLLTRAAGLGDVRAIGSRSIGATNVLRTGNKTIAALTLLFDLLKGTAAVIAGMFIAAKLASAFVGPPNGVLVFFLVPWFAGLGAVAGHLFPVWLGFKGGKVVATYIGVLVGVALMSRSLWAAPFVFCLTWLAVALVTRYSSLASLAGTVATFFYFMLYGGPLVIAVVSIISALIYWKHRENIRRLAAGQESRIGAKA
jgi:acyl phosphate:glycerol-3-phosphate acyltransferase